MGRRSFFLAGTLSLATLSLDSLFHGRSADAAVAAPYPVVHSRAEWRRLLTPTQYQVLRAEATEPAHSSPLAAEARPGTYGCAGCGQDLFTSAAKFTSNTGWPSFWAPLDDALSTTTDSSFFLVRTEAHCSRCGSHLGQVFEDGPPPTGLRYSMNGVALVFRPAASVAA